MRAPGGEERGKFFRWEESTWPDLGGAWGAAGKGLQYSTSLFLNEAGQGADLE